MLARPATIVGLPATATILPAGLVVVDARIASLLGGPRNVDVGESDTLVGLTIPPAKVVRAPNILAKVVVRASCRSIDLLVPSFLLSIL